MARVLVVNDQKDLATICRLILESVGHEVETVLQGSRAVGVAQRFRPELILLDWVLPDLRGDKILEQLRRTPATQAVPIIVMSALEGLESQARNLGAEGYLAKPFDAESLLQAVKSIVG